MLSQEHSTTGCEITGLVNSIESFGSVDGPGVRFILFMQGCAMRCRYCHNPETWSSCPEGVMKLTPRQALDMALRYKSYWKGGGGITVSGGEAMLQIDFVTELFRLCKEEGVNTALDTSGNPFTYEEPYFTKFKALCDVTDLFILDIKHIDDDAHKALTGCTNTNILEMARYLSDNGKHMWIRHVLVPGLTDDEDALYRLGDFIKTLGSVDRVEVLPYHSLGIAKWDRLGLEYTLRDTRTPSKEQMDIANRLLHTADYKGYKGE